MNTKNENETKRSGVERLQGLRCGRVARKLSNGLAVVAVELIVLAD